MDVQCLDSQLSNIGADDMSAILLSLTLEVACIFIQQVLSSTAASVLYVHLCTNVPVVSVNIMLHREGLPCSETLVDVFSVMSSA